MNELLEQIEKMSREELEALFVVVERKLQELEVPFAPEDREELARRLALADANPLEGKSWADIRADYDERAQILRAEEAFEADKIKGEGWVAVRERILSPTPKAESVAA